LALPRPYIVPLRRSGGSVPLRRSACAAFAAIFVITACSRDDAPRAERQRDGVDPPGVASATPSPALDAKAPSNTAVAADALLDLPRFEGGTRAVAGEHGLVVAVEAKAARAGARVLEEGGNAVDAAVATLFALAVTHPSAASLGGGGFALVRAPGTTTTAVDFVPTAPAARPRERFQRMIAAGAKGADAAGVPGFVAGLALLHHRFGKKPWKELLAPAIELAAKGQPLPAHAARLLARAFAELRADPAE
jgi:gamma-glutamyltranspeptidase/glutathione hydrolase